MKIEAQDAFEVNSTKVDIFLELKERGLNFLIGPNGIGKTSLFTYLKLNPTIFGNLKATYVSQSRLSPLSDLSVGDTLKVVEEEVSGAIDWKIDPNFQKLEIKKLLSKKVSALSGGENQKLKIALALMVPFDILLLDEPLQNLDKDNQQLLISLLTELSKEKLVLIIEHDLNKYPEFVGNVNVMSRVGDKIEVKHA